MGIRELRAVALITQEKTLPPGSVIVAPQAPLGELYLIIKGHIRRRRTADGETEILAKGDFFGEIDLFSPRSSDYAYTAEDEVELF